MCDRYGDEINFLHLTYIKILEYHEIILNLKMISEQPVNKL